METSNPIHHLEEQLWCPECQGSGCFACDDRGVWYPGWYFWNEVWADRIGPFETEEEAKQKCREYAAQL